MITLQTLNVLLVEDQLADAYLILDELHSTGLDPHAQRVDTETAFIDHLNPPPDIILADYSLPQFGAVRALEILQEYAFDIPLIVITGTVTEETVVDCMRHGAADYLMKDRLTRLSEAIRHALAQKEAREAKRSAESALRESETSFRALFANNPHPMWVYDLETLAFLDVNDAAVAHYGYSREEFLEMRIMDIRPEEDSSALLGDLAQTRLAFRESHSWRHQTKTGQLIQVEITSHTLDFVGRRAVLVVAQDVTERKRLEAELLASEVRRVALEKEQELLALKERFMSLVSHEFRTPLTVMLTSTQILKTYSERLSPEKRQAQLDKIEGQIHFMTSLINDVLLIDKAQAGKLVCHPQLLHLEQFCRATFEDLQASDAIGHIFRFTSEDTLHQVCLDEALLRHILVNLLSNAIKYSPAGKAVRFDLFRQDDEAVLRISDEGIGIPSEDVQHLFEPFHRADNAQQIAGTGLGLVIVSESVKTHGGRLICESTEGVGTTFTVYLPLTIIA